MKNILALISACALCLTAEAQVTSTIPSDSSGVPLGMAFQSAEIYTNIVAPNTNMVSITNAVGIGPYHTDVFIITSNLLAGSILLDQYSLDGSNWCTTGTVTVGTVSTAQAPLIYSNIFVGKWDYWRVNYQGTNLQAVFETEAGR